MGVQDPRIFVPLNPFCLEMTKVLAEKYGLSKTTVCRFALEAGLRQIAVPSGAPAGIALPAGEGF